MKKRIFMVLLAIGMVGVIASCGKTATSENVVEPYKVGTEEYGVSSNAAGWVVVQQNLDKVVIEDLPNGASEDTCLRDNTDEGSIEICKYADMAIENGYKVYMCLGVRTSEDKVEYAYDADTTDGSRAVIVVEATGEDFTIYEFVGDAYEAKIDEVVRGASDVEFENPEELVEDTVYEGQVIDTMHGVDVIDNTIILPEPESEDN